MTPLLKEKIESVALLIERLAQMVHNLGYQSGLKPSQWNALRYFSRANISVRTVTWFGRHNGTSQSAASQTVSSLVQRGLLHLESDERDRRKRIVQVTQAGLKYLEQDPLEPLQAMLQSIPPSDLAAFSKVAVDIMRAELGRVHDSVRNTSH